MLTSNRGLLLAVLVVAVLGVVRAGTLSNRRLLATANAPESEIESSECELDLEVSVEEANEAVLEAVRHDSVEELEKALQACGQPNAKSATFAELHALHVAAEHDNYKVAKVLLDAGAAPDVQDRFGLTPLHYAGSHGSVRLIQLLLDAGGDPNKADVESNTPLHFAASNGHAKAIQALVDGGIGIDLADGGGDTALHQASENGHVEVVELLLMLGADKTIPDTGGGTPVDEICEDVESCTPETVAKLEALLSFDR